MSGLWPGSGEPDVGDYTIVGDLDAMSKGQLVDVAKSVGVVLFDEPPVEVIRGRIRRQER